MGRCPIPHGGAAPNPAGGLDFPPRPPPSSIPAATDPAEIDIFLNFEFLFIFLRARDRPRTHEITTNNYRLTTIQQRLTTKT